MAKKSAGVLLLRDERGEFVLLGLMGRNAWDLPKGGIEDGEEPFETAKRELKEEAGVTDVTWVQTDPIVVNYQLRSKQEKQVSFFVGTTTKSKITISKEHQSYRWIPVSEAKTFLPERFHPLVDWLSNNLPLQKKETST